MSFLSDANIVLSPNGGKVNKIYCLKPTDGSGDLNFSRSSTATIVASNGLIEPVVSDYPRISFEDGVGSCPSLLLEPARTNLLTYSEQFDNAGWVKSGGGATTISPNATTAPDGTLTADDWVINTAGARFLRQIITTTSNNLTASFFVKANTTDWFFIFLTDGVDSAGYTFDVSNGIIGSSVNSTVALTPNIEDFGGGWFRCSLNTSLAVGSVEVRGYVAESSTSVSSQVGNSVYVWGAQFEEGGYPTSYIKTEAATVTRSAENLSKTGIPDLLGDSEGTLYFEAVVPDLVGAYAVSINDGSFSNSVAIQFDGTGSIRFRLRLAAVDELQIISASGLYSANETVKIAVKYAQDDFVVYLNGSVIISSSSGNTFPNGTLNTLSFNRGSGVDFYGNVKALAVWDTALTDAELQQITT